MKARSSKILSTVLALLPIVIMCIAGYFSLSNEIPRKLTIMLTLVLIIIVSTGFLYFHKKQLAFNHMMFMSIVIAIVGVISFYIRDTSYLYMPMLIAVMLIAMIIDEQIALLMHFALLAIIAIVVGYGTVFLIYYGILGVVTAFTVNYSKERNKMLLIVGSLAVFSSVLHTLLAYTIYDVFKMSEVLLAMANSALSLIIVIGSLPLWESIFKVMTPLKLMEFANSDNKLLQRLLIEAPGTYHHVQMVGNLAERATKSVGGNSLLAKTAAVYHDVGKLKEPLYFIENQNGGPNPHDEIAAEASASIIIEHVAYGVKLAQEHKLPLSIIDIIKQHHGTSLVAYFYHKAQNYKDGVEYPEEKFRYDGPKPQTKEAAIVMLADCVEAFVRSLSEKDRNLEKIRWIIQEIIRQKFEDGQLDECPLQIAELKSIGEAFMQVYNGLYHERISYPEKG